MMLSHPVILGFVWSLLIQCLSGQPQISSQETNKVYAYSYHFQHNGTTNSQDILRRVLGADPEFGISDDQSIVKTFSSPNIRGFFTKGVLPVGPQNYNSGFGSPRFNVNPALENIKKVVEANLQPPREIATGLLPPISPDIVNDFPRGYNNGNDIGLNFQKQDDFPKIPPPPSFSPQNDFPKIPSPPLSPEIDFPKIPEPPQPLNHDNGVSKVETFSRNTPDGGKIEGQIETFSYNPQPVLNSNSNYQENAHGFRRSENFVNGNQGTTGHRTQTYFRQQFRTVTPNLESNSLYNQNSRIDSSLRNNHNNNQWWNVLNVLGENNNNRNNRNSENLGKQVERNINEVKSNLNNQINTVFGSRISGSVNNRQNNYNNQNRQTNVIQNNAHNNNIPNFNNRNFRNQPVAVIPFSNRIDSNNNNNGYNNQPTNNYNNNRRNANVPFRNNRQNNNGYSNSNNVNDKFNNDDTTKEVLNIINNVNNQLGNFNNNNAGNRPNLRLTWDDDVSPNIPNINPDWSRRQSRGNGRPFSNAHSGPLNMPVGPNPVEALKSTIENIVGGRDYQIPAIPDLGDRGGSYRNVGGGGVEKFFGVDKVVEGPNSYSRNQHRGFERNFHVDSNTGYQRTNQWSTNTLRRLDAQSSRNDFSKDFIDVFRDDY